jgi:hypothetical protein
MLQADLLERAIEHYLMCARNVAYSHAGDGERLPQQAARTLRDCQRRAGGRIALPVVVRPDVMPVEPGRPPRAIV